ncbi:MAG: Membrane-anchored ribosome-binding protein inhibits growth in stationary phase, ElaB/YqjD/DUF883 [Hydrocarboniphaga sp.]|uniref:DUF883 family protein n=1 Tax=Hydrocarboniphaga sp. TaxID=2033016 RepID=UPI002613FE75|nr:DUF883 family protein [Hydrocarboniphaga sp.]MDB5970860.1 Membrane-anchored ribosome-binding protein inhibits growth in stationary phase, ElaB/YqjD/DUF883 [Hydrocarboniphaga sp.]
MKNLSSAADVGAARENLASDFHSLVNHAEELLHATTSLSNETVDMARQKLNDSLRQVKAQIGPVRDAAYERGKLAVDTAVTFARERPWQTAAIVCLAALTIGFIGSLGSRK